MPIKLSALLTILLIILAQPLKAQEEPKLTKTQIEKLKKHEEKEIEKEIKVKEAKKLGTIRIYPDITTNLSMARSRYTYHYVMIRLDLIASDQQYAELIDKHQPLIIDKLILFFNRQTIRNFSTESRKQKLKRRIVTIINKALYPEIKKNVVDDIIVQKLIVE